MMMIFERNQIAVDTTKILCQVNQINKSGISKELIIAILKALYPSMEKKKTEYLSCPFLQKRIDNDKNKTDVAMNDVVISDLNCVTVIIANKKRKPKLLKKLLITFCFSSPLLMFLKILPAAIVIK